MNRSESRTTTQKRRKKQAKTIILDSWLLNSIKTLGRHTGAGKWLPGKYLPVVCWFNLVVPVSIPNVDNLIRWDFMEKVDLTIA